MTREEETSLIGEIQKYLDLAERLDELDPKVSYQCRFYAMRKGCILSRENPADSELRQALGEQMTKLEQTKAAHGGEDGKDKVLTLATLTLKGSEADFENGIKTEDTFKNYLTVVNLLDVLRDNDGNLPPNLQQLQKTAKWKATEVLKEIKSQKAAAAPPPQQQNFDQNFLAGQPGGYPAPSPGGFPSPSGASEFPSTPSGAGGFPSTHSGFPSTPSGFDFPSTPSPGGPQPGGFPSTPSGFPSAPSGGGFNQPIGYGAPPPTHQPDVPQGYNFPSTPSGGFPTAPSGGAPAGYGSNNGYPSSTLQNGAPPPQSFDSMFPSTPSNRAPSPNPHPSTPLPGAQQVLPPAPASAPAPAQPKPFVQDFSTVIGKKGNASDSDIEMACRLSKHAASALQYDDVPTAILKLEQALALLKK